MAEEPIELRLFVTGAEDVPITFSNLAIVQHEQQEFVLTFAQYSPPLILGDADSQRQQIESMPYLPVKVVSRIGMTAPRMAQLIQVLQENYNNYQGKQGNA